MTLAVAPGTRVVVRDEEWLVRLVRETKSDGLRVEVTGISDLVRDQDAVFFERLDEIEPVDPTKTRLVPDNSPQFSRSRLWLEALLRRTPIEASDDALAIGHRGLLDPLTYQHRPAALALQNLQPRILVADAVGLGKTLEIGIILSELIRRGRGERICVVTPRAVLEQFQREMWTRFSIPLVRLDSDGIAQIRQELPATRNPFTYYKRVIVSIDTLKNPHKFRAFLKDHRWDAVVIDECHNVVNPGSQNFKLAKNLAEHTDALILASATPHNGKPESFAQLINLLDPTAITDKRSYDAGDIGHLFVRRHRGSPDVTHEVAHMWAERADPDVKTVQPSAQEAAVLAELNDTWLRPANGSPPSTGKGARLFPWTLFKAFLSSTRALRETIKAHKADTEHEQQALDTLDAMAAAVQQDPSGESKLTKLAEFLRDTVGVGPGAPARAVIFTERIATLRWLQEELPKRLGLDAKAVAALYGSQPDKAQMQVVEQFGLEQSPIRVLIASDMASEGINLHKQCSHLIHFDLPWSLIRLQQRNGRIDRYGQTQTPRIYALALTPEDPNLASDLTVITRLVSKEQAAHTALGSADALMHLHDVAAEEDAIRDVLMHRRSLDEVVPDPVPENLDPFERLMAMGGAHEGETPAKIAELPGLFGSDLEFLCAALDQLDGDLDGVAPKELDLVTEEDTDLLAITPPRDLIRRMTALPASYLREREVTTRLRVTQDPEYAKERLRLAQDAQKISWPDCLYLSPLHPVLDWAADRVLASFARDEAPVLAANVSEPVFCVQATWSNARGQAVLVHWGAVTGLPGESVVSDMMTALEQAGIRSGADNPGIDTERSLPLPYLTLAVDAERDWLWDTARARADELAPRIKGFTGRLSRWTTAQGEQLTLFGGPESLRRSRQREIDEVRAETVRLIDSFSPAGDPLIRVVAVLVPSRS
jgi:superfamily II DNA or RNA helicase